MPGSAADRLAATWELTLQAWAIAGLPLPDYDRANTPIRLVRPEQADP